MQLYRTSDPFCVAGSLVYRSFPLRSPADFADKGCHSARQSRGDPLLSQPKFYSYHKSRGTCNVLIPHAYHICNAMLEIFGVTFKRRIFNPFAFNLCARNINMFC